MPSWSPDEKGDPAVPKACNLFADLPSSAPAEIFERLDGNAGILIERIISTGQKTPDDEWLEQDRTEWVVLLRGRASLRFEGAPQTRELGPGDYTKVR